ncbi:hypothetical protein C0J52_00659 [Blattella germanica]|nr:hypothetical protein C0J52_00659 [Blattella germanica]
MAHRQNSSRHRNYSSCSNSSSASVSPSSSSTLNFTLYGGPAPRSLHRTTTGAAKARPKRRSNKPTPPPPTTPLSMCCPEDNNFPDFKLDLSSLAAEDETIIVSNNTEVYYSEHKVLVHTSFEISDHDISDRYLQRTDSNVSVDNEQMLQEKKCDINDRSSGSNSMRSTESDKDLVSQTCSELDLSSQGYVEVLFGNDSYRSNISNSSSYITVSEYSVNSLSSIPSSCSSKHNSTPKKHDEKIDTCIENSSSENNRSTRQISRMSEYESKKVENTMETDNESRRIFSENETQYIKKITSQYESLNNDIQYVKEENTIVNLKTIDDIYSVSPEINSLTVNSDEICKELREVDNLTRSGKEFNVVIPKDSFTVETDSQILCSTGTSIPPFEAAYSTNFEKSDNEHGMDSCDQPELYGYYVYNEGHETPSDEWTVEDDSPSFSDDLCPNQEASLQNYDLLIKSNSVLKGGEIPFRNYSKINGNSFVTIRNANCCNEYNQEILFDAQGSSTGNCLQTGSSMSELYFQTSPHSQISSINDNKTISEAIVTPDERNIGVKRRVLSAPIQSRPLESIRSPAVPLDSERQARFLLENLDSGYLSDIPAPDITMTAGDIMEAVLYARQLVRVLERTLDRALSSARKTSSTNTSVRCHYSEKRNENRRCRSLSPSLLRHCKGLNRAIFTGSNNCVTSRENESLNVENLENHSTDLPEKINDCGYEKKLSCNGKCDNMNFCKPYILSITPEQLQKQRALLKPAAQRSLQETVAQVLDMADILKNVISRRRLVMDPTEELICGTNRSVSEWSLENSPRNGN